VKPQLQLVPINPRKKKSVRGKQLRQKLIEEEVVGGES
jgi:hypothetical protein